MINRDTLELIKEYEGVRLTAYPDPGSLNGLPWTIGYGHTKGVKKGDKITEAQAEQFLIEDLKEAERVIEKHVRVPLNENQYGALVSFIHNLGETQFANGSIKAYINEGRLAEVPNRIALYNKNDGKVMKGLVRRREAEIALWRKPTGIKPREVPPVPLPRPKPTKKSWLTVLLDFLLGLFKRK
jgi:lysozyme